MSGKTFLITRALGDEEELREHLQAQGHRVIHEPLTEIFLQHTARAQLHQAILQEPDAVIVTSRYGIRALAALEESRDMMIVCVGASTAETAESMGFTRVAIGGKDVDALIDYIVDAYDADSRFLYASGEHIHADLPGMLGGYGMSVTRIVLYEATASHDLSDTLIEKLKRGQLDAVTFLSSRSSHIFIELLSKAGIEETVATVEAYCLSGNVASPLEHLGWKHIYVAREPTLASLMECVDNSAHD